MWSGVISPYSSARRSTIGASGSGTATRNAPIRMTFGSGNAMMTPSRAVTKRPAPPPSSSSGPTTNPPCCGGKHRAEQIQDGGGRSDRILREQQGVRRVIVNAAAQRVGGYRPFEREDAADRVQGEPERQLDRRGELDRQHQHERERVRVEEADRLDLDRAELEIERSAVLAVFDRQESAAVDQSGVDAEPSAVGGCSSSDAGCWPPSNFAGSTAKRTPAPSTTAAIGPSEPAIVPVISKASGPTVGISRPSPRRSTPGNDSWPGRSMRCFVPAWNVSPFAVSRLMVRLTDAVPPPPRLRRRTASRRSRRR